MINKKIQFVRPGLFLPSFKIENYNNSDLIVRPSLLSICAADQRYFSGTRSLKVLEQKLPMSLIHEGIGEVLFDPKRKLRSGQKVILLPNGGNNNPQDNYSNGSLFRSSTTDGFTQEFLLLKANEVVPFDSEFSQYYVLTELMSVCFHAIRRIPMSEWRRVKSVGIWGDGSVGYLLSLCLKKEFPNLLITVFGKHEEKLMLFSHVDELIILKNDSLQDYSIDLAFETVGGDKSSNAINQIIDLISPCSLICLMGVSENNIPIDTRKVLEKGLCLFGSSRSLREDFFKAKQFIDSLEDFSVLDKIISKRFKVSSSEDLTDAFLYDQKTRYKTLLNWEL